MNSSVLRLRCLGQRLTVARRGLHTRSILACPEIPFKLADIGEGIAEVEVLQWFVKSGDEVKQFQNVCEVQSDKATVEITSRFDGVVTKVHYDVGELAKVGSTLIDIEVDEATAATIHGGKKNVAPILSRTPTPVAVKPVVAAPLPMPASSAASPTILSRIPVTPSRLEEGTGPQGRILKGDLLNFIREIAAQPAQPITSAFQSSVSVQTLTADKMHQDTVVPLTPIQKAMIKSMNAALRIPHFGYADEIRMDALYTLRNELKPLAESRDIKLSFMPFIIKAVSLALKHYPMLNATVNENEDELSLIGAHNISVAMDTPMGLLVPNIKNVQARSIMDIAEELNRLQLLAATGKLAPADLTGGTFSISNIGSIGGTYMSPVLMVPQVAIGAVGRIQKIPRFDAEGNVKAVRLMNVSWSGDHRVIDGATMARFSNQWKSYLEIPVSMLTELS
ncbi:lipoamide acyltransferase component of branched-chain alpha-keto acid dehydrogenase [Plasmopara halstedii]|uniref:Dihydrolipoamide acetyltransferase component of pyruvate dehydrogenase complex n=1 Tax=Plasmopara halstedii TaxID=4781 RepID=A0A0P1AQ11_PLAHL|nr:lipoamide acyltransferase component of branched-chain alpha-keto acid dehydrogenase [Plasmopara halstedii]CEG43297.1 lipoamide acyltransferase component of branched-chain alpha-keto acid dehydrogenase [Plasmopara halstedii]|eukprot:XP_024579666.1 lipoamide acyltransferase component of branched-chain alpha-keto acid dehydrogenase [Plasmopara halstedii]